MGPLDGIRVVELSDTQAGCVAGMLLADYGAAVTRVDRPGSTASRATPGFLVWNRGKQSLSLSLDHPQGQEVFLRLLGQTDVLVQTLDPGLPERRGIDYATLHARFPRLVYCSITGYDQDGPDWGRPGDDGLVQAKAGVMLSGPMPNGIPSSWAQGGPRPGPKYMGFSAPSYAAAFFGTLGILTALVVRGQTGQGQHVNSSLHSGIMAMTRRSWAEHPGPPPSPGRGLYGIWQCGDGEWLWTHTGARGSFDRFMQIFGLEVYMAAAPSPIPWSSQVTNELRAKVIEVMLTKPRAEWTRRFDAADCPNQSAMRPGESFDDEQANVVNMVVTVDDPELGVLQEVGVPIKFRATPGNIRSSAPRAGEHTAQILQGLGFTKDELSHLLASGVIGEAT